jgi:DNA-binding transcriptional MerR regulator
MRKSAIAQPVTRPILTVGSDVVWLAVRTPAPLIEGEVLTIGQMAEKFGVTLRTLRFYEIKGLFAPVRDGRARLYTQADQQRLLLILKGRKLGFTISEISQMLLAAEDGRGPPQSLKIPRGKCLEQIELLERQLDDTNEALAELRRLNSC